MIKKLISIALIFILLFIMTIPSIAATQSEIDDLEDQKSDAEAELEDIQSEMSTTEQEIEDLRAEISEYESEIETLNDKIEELEESIDEKEEEIAELEEENKEREDLLVNRLVAMYEKGQTTYLDVLLSSESITTFISNYYRIEEITEADQEVINSILEKQKETQAAKEELQKEQNELDEAKQELEDKTTELEAAKKEKDAKLSSLSEEEQEIQNKIDEFEAAIKKAEEELAAKEKANIQQVGSYEGSFTGVLEWPLSYSYNIITSIFGNRTAPTAGASSNHGAIDIGVSYVAVYAPADGKVIYAGWSGGYGNYIKIDHGNGYYTAFAHLSSINVSVGDVVSTGQQIAVSGNTGISTGPHLHYEVYIGGTTSGYRVDPLLYTSHPSLVYY